MKVAIIGGGISGITAALYLQRFKNVSCIDMMVMNRRLGGRIYSVKSKEYWVDLGANLLDFQTEESEKEWKGFFPEHILNNFNQFKQPFMIFQKQHLRKGDYYKPRYYYRHGFNQFINDLEACLDSKVKVHLLTKVQTITSNKEQIELSCQSPLQSRKSRYDALVICCPPHNVVKAFSQCPPELTHLHENTRYTKQICMGFVAKENMPAFSCILFKDHPITFICNHQEKYGEPVICVQMNEEFSENHMESTDEEISNKVYWEVLPKEMREWVEENCIHVRKWKTALLKPRPYDFKQLGNIIMAGDGITSKSRISSNVQSTIKALQSFSHSSHI